MFSCRVSDRLELRLLQMSDADELFAQVDANRAYLRQWLPWLDTTKALTDTQEFIRYTLQQFAENQGVFAHATVEADAIASVMVGEGALKDPINTYSSRSFSHVINC
jgi:RimJ/RimL family protein N-acetyltransferase